MGMIAPSDRGRNGSTSCCSWALRRAPTFALARRPPQNTIVVGTDWIRSWPASIRALSMSTLTNFALPASSRAKAANSGAMVLHGPHHSAMKSTTTGSSLERTSCSKLCSSTRGISTCWPRAIGSPSGTSPHLVIGVGKCKGRGPNQGTRRTNSRGPSSSLRAKPASDPLCQPVTRHNRQC